MVCGDTKVLCSLKTWTHKSKIVNMKNVKLLAIKWICEFNWYIVQSASHEP